MSPHSKLKHHRSEVFWVLKIRRRVCRFYDCLYWKQIIRHNFPKNVLDNLLSLWPSCIHETVYATKSKNKQLLGISMRTFLALAFLFGITLFGKAAETPSGLQEGSVWYWQARGNGQKMKLEVRLDNKTIFMTTFPVAQTDRSAIPKKSHTKKIRFSFKPKRSIVWSGYRDDDVVSPIKQQIECDIWMAGADENAVILGVSFDRSDAILMNTLHLALPTSEARSEIADGLVVVTSPVTDKKPNNRSDFKI